MDRSPLPRHQVDAVVAAARTRAEELIGQGAPLRDVLAQLTGAVEHLFDDCAASILVLDREGLLRNGASPSLPADYLDKIDRIKPDAGVGTCAAAAATGEVVFTPDFQEDRKWAELKHLPISIGFHSAWSMPIKADAGQVLGTFGTYFRARRSPTVEEQEVVGALMPVASQAIAAHIAAR